MKAGFAAIFRAILRTAALAACLAAGSARADDAHGCDVPDYLLASDSALPKVAEALKVDHKLEILVVGSRSSTIGTIDGSAYPARLQAALRD